MVPIPPKIALSKRKKNSIKSFYGHLPLKQDQLMRKKLIKGTSLYSDSHEQSNESPIVTLQLCKKNRWEKVDHKLSSQSNANNKIVLI